MSIFAKGDFNIKETWTNEKDQSKDKDKDKDKGLKKNSILQNAAKNSFESPIVLDDKIARKVLKDFSLEGAIEGFQSNKNIERTPSRAGSEKGSRKVIDQPISSKNLALPPKQKASDKNDDLMSSMAARLTKLQQTCKVQRLQIKEKTEQIEKLKEQNQFMKGAKNSPEGALKENISLREQNAALKKKVQEMEVFLKSYGLKWVGNKMEGNLDKDKLKKDMEKPKYNYHLPSQVDISTVMRRIQELNMGLHEEGTSSNEVYRDANGMHRFRPTEPLLLGFYKDGIAIQGYKFFPYKSKQSIQILGDILDGYFPYVLKAKYPNGTFLKVVDKIDNPYDTDTEKGGIQTFETAQQKKLKPMSKQEFLNKLPKSITKNGKVIEVRAAIENKLDGKKDSPPIKQQDQNEHFQQDAEGTIIFKTPSVSEQDICQLKIRTEKGQICLLKLNKNSKMVEVYKWMRHVCKSTTGFKVLGNYPKREYSEKQAQTLDELGLAPNSVLHIEILK